MRKTIETIERLRNSHYGNPRFRFRFTDGDIHDSQSDASWGYEIGNPGYREGSTVDIELTRAGRIRLMRAVR